MRIVDPTRTTSRNHAAISIDTDGALWIEDYGSLNGTYIITNGQETQVTKAHRSSSARLPRCVSETSSSSSPKNRLE